MTKLDEVKMEVVEAKAPSLTSATYSYKVQPVLAAVDTHEFVVKTEYGYKWRLYNGPQLVLEPRYNQHDMLYLGKAFNFELVVNGGSKCLKVTPK